METETSQRQRGVVGATCDARAAEKHPPQGAKALKCASFAFEMCLKFRLKYATGTVPVQMYFVQF
jgi:hypothetical protein